MAGVTIRVREWRDVLTVSSFAFATGIASGVANRYTRVVTHADRCLGVASRVWFGTLLSALVYSAVIGLVSTYDILLTIQYAGSLSQLEENPIGRWIMNIQESDVYLLEAPPRMTLFLVLKGLGTALVIAVINGLIRWRRDMGHTVASAVTLFQVGLLMYLTI